ncbi:hypothetical protein C8Q74DRAFT_918067 [Fomes fomentarius]|nr:hypothetical protein C8Q74DRAFT_918067 [Fomes fomentarius]
MRVHILTSVRHFLLIAYVWTITQSSESIPFNHDSMVLRQIRILRTYCVAWAEHRPQSGACSHQRYRARYPSDAGARPAPHQLPPY